MTCPNCGSQNVHVVMDTAQKIKKSSCLVRFGRLLLIFCTAGLWLLVPQKVGHTKSKAVCLCQNCGKKF